jgi:hypothetical protein
VSNLKLAPLLVGALLVALASGTTRAGAESLVFENPTSGSQVVPPVVTNLRGFVRFFFNEDRSQAMVTIDVQGIDGGGVLGADIHRAAPGSNGPLVMHLADGGFIVIGVTIRLTPAQLEEMASGVWYVVVRTVRHPQGELRGQIIVPPGFLPREEAPAEEPLPPAAAIAEGAPPAAAPEAGAGLRNTPPNPGEAGLARDAADGRATTVGAALALASLASAFLGRRRPAR